MDKTIKCPHCGKKWKTYHYLERVKKPLKLSLLIKLHDWFWKMKNRMERQIVCYAIKKWEKQEGD